MTGVPGRSRWAASSTSSPLPPGMRRSLITRSRSRVSSARAGAADVGRRHRLVAEAGEQDRRGSRAGGRRRRRPAPSPPLTPPPRSAGRRMVKQAPPGGWLSAAIVPPCSSTMRRAMARPRPVPSGLVVQNGENRRGRTSGAMPGPLSAHATTTQPSVAAAGERSSPGPCIACSAFCSQVEQHLVELIGAAAHRAAARPAAR